MKQYLISKIEKFGLKIKKINYSFKVSNTNPPTRFIKIIVHHTGRSKTIQEIIDLHVKKNHWSSIGYHFMIGKRGQIYYSRDLKYAGAHTFEYNKNSIGIALFGDFDESEPTEKQLIILNELINALKNEFNIKRVLGHNEAIYELLKKRYWKANINDIDIFNFKSTDDYNRFQLNVFDKILKVDADEYTISLIKRLKSCPGLNMYKFMKKIIKNK